MGGRWRVDAVGDRVQGGGNVATLGVGRSVAERAVEILARVLLLVLAGKVQPIGTIAAIMGSLMPGVGVSKL